MTYEQQQRYFTIYEAFNAGARDCLRKAGRELDADALPFYNARCEVQQRLCPEDASGVLVPDFEIKLEAYRTGWGVAETVLGRHVSRPRWLWLGPEKSWAWIVGGLDSRGCH